MEYAVIHRNEAGALNMEKKISLRVSDEDLEVIDTFISRNDFPNRSTFIREAALEYIDHHTTKKGHKEIPSRIILPSKFKNTIHYLIALGHYESWEEAIKDLVKKAIMAEDIKEIERKHKVIGDVSGRVQNILDVEKQKEQEYMSK